MTASPLPDCPDPCGWNAMLAPRVPQPPAEGELRVQYAVVGAGYTGLAAARRLAGLDPDAEIAVLEGSTVGEGASARNSGFASPYDPKVGQTALERDRAAAVNRFFAEGFDYLEEAMRRGGFSCDLENVGRILAAATEAGDAKVQGMLDAAAAHGLAHARLDRAALLQRIGTDYYRTAARLEVGYVLQPAALIRGLAATLPPTVRLFESTPVLGLEDERPWLLRTPRARIRADVVVLAANAGVRHFGVWRDGLVTIHTYAGITEEMSDADAASLGAPAWGLLPAHRLGATLRRVGPRRLLVRSLYAYEKPLPSAHARAALADCFGRRFPRLAHVKLEHVWGGVTALTMNGAPRWGKVREGVYASAGCNGAGIVKGTLLGKRLAESIVTGDPQEALQSAFGRAGWIAPEPFRSIGFRVVSRMERRRAGAEI